MRYNFLACPCSIYATIIYVLAPNSKITSALLKDIQDTLGLAVNILNIKTNSSIASSAFYPSQLVLFVLYHHLLVYSPGLVYSEGAEGLSILLENENNVSTHVLLSLKNIVFNDQGN